MASGGSWVQILSLGTLSLLARDSVGGLHPSWVSLVVGWVHDALLATSLNSQVLSWLASLLVASLGSVWIGNFVLSALVALSLLGHKVVGLVARWLLASVSDNNLVVSAGSTVTLSVQNLVLQASSWFTILSGSGGHLSWWASNTLSLVRSGSLDFVSDRGANV